ncbi:AAA family ATPase [Geobacter anodireducens]
MLTALHLGNFKAFADTQNIPIKPITLIFGPNSAGKSSIIHSLALAHEASRKGDLDIFRTEVGGSSIDLGGFRQYVHRRQANRRVEWGATFDTSRLSGRLAELLKPVGTLAVHLTMGVQLDDEDKPVPGASPTVISYELESRGELLIRMSRRPDGGMAVDRLNHEHPVIKQFIMAVLESSTTTQTVTEADYTALQDGIAEIVSSLRSTGGKFLPRGISLKDAQLDETQSMLPFFTVSRGERGKDLTKALRFFLPRSLDELISGMNKAIGLELERIQYLGPLRSYPPRHLAFSEHDDVNWYAGGGYAWDVVRKNTAVRKKVNGWLNNPDRLKTPYELSIQNLLTIDDLGAEYEELVSNIEERFTGGEPYDWDLFGELYEVLDKLKENDSDHAHIQELVLIDKRTETRVSHRDVGIGVSQVLPVLVGAYASQNQIIAIEQPEIHLHPALQAELGDVFIESALGEQKNTFILETHSEHLILRLLRRIRETVDNELPEGKTPFTAGQLTILYVQPGKNGSELVEIPVSEDGEFMKPWPDGFFAERARELY